MQPRRQSEHALARNPEPRAPGARPPVTTPGLRRRFVLLAGAAALAIALLVALSYAGFEILSGTRAYVHGESQWAKAQKRAVIALFRYAGDGDDSHLEQARQELEVNRGDRRARRALNKPDPDWAAARRGFLDGRNHPEDIERLIRLYRWGRGLELFDRAVAVWSRGDDEIDQLLQLSRQLQRAVTEDGAGSSRVDAVLADIVALDAELTQLEDEFSALMGRLSQQMTVAFSLVIVITALALLLGGTWLTYRLTRSAETADRALRESELRYRALVHQTEVGMWQLDEGGGLVYLNPAMRRLAGLDDDADVTGLGLDRFVADGERERLRENLDNWAEGQATTGEFGFAAGSDDPRKVLLHGAPVILEDGRLRGHVGTCVDITERKHAEEQLRHQAFHDPLTGLPNRHLFMDRLQMALRRSRRSEKTLAVLFVDLDGFKTINDSAGHAVGDWLLVEAARRMAAVIREKDTVARLGGDEFGVIVEEVERPGDAARPAHRIIESMEREFLFGETSTHIGASIGIALSGDTRQRPSDLLRLADRAMYLAKNAGGQCWRFHEADGPD